MAQVKPEDPSILPNAQPQEVAAVLARTYPDAHRELGFTSPLELLAATVRPAQTTRGRVHQITPELFERYPLASDLAQADPEVLEAVLRPLGFFRTKAKALIGLGDALQRDYDGVVPGDLDALVALPGVGRKTANVVLGNAFGVPGITVDTRVGRLSRRLGWTTAKDPVAVERELGALFPPEDWVMLCHRLIFHGRRVCFARKPDCEACPLVALCPSALV